MRYSARNSGEACPTSPDRNSKQQYKRLLKVTTFDNAVSRPCLLQYTLLIPFRNAEYPDVVVRLYLRYCPPIIPPPHEWNSSRTASMSQLIPVADIRGLQRMPSLNFPDQLKIREPGKDLPSLPRASTAPPMRRKTSDIRVPGAFVEAGQVPTKKQIWMSL
jgi:hypothetical protein